MDSSTGILIGKIAFYAALAALLVVIIIKKRKQSHDIHRDDQNFDEKKQ
jgi:hypothetical protein